MQTETVLSWIDDAELAAISSASFWNDAEKEKEKPYHVTNDNAEKLWTFLRDETTYFDQYMTVVRVAEELGAPVKGRGVDVAAGVCWTTALLARIPQVDQIYALEISRHRLTQIAPNVCSALGAPAGKVVRVLGSFYDIRLPDGSVDFCMMSQAFHHADDPQKLLAELRRVLKPGAPALIMGEDPLYPMTVVMKRIKNVAKMVLPRRLYIGPPVYKFFPSFSELFPIDLESGDHYYRIRDYHAMFSGAGFTLHAKRNGDYTVFVAIRNK